MCLSEDITHESTQPSSFNFQLFFLFCSKSSQTEGKVKLKFECQVVVKLILKKRIYFIFNSLEPTKFYFIFFFTFHFEE